MFTFACSLTTHALMCSNCATIRPNQNALACQRGFHNWKDHSAASPPPHWLRYHVPNDASTIDTFSQPEPWSCHCIKEACPSCTPEAWVRFPPRPKFTNFFLKPFIYIVYMNLPEKFDANPSVSDAYLLLAPSAIFGRIAQWRARQCQIFV